LANDGKPWYMSNRLARVSVSKNDVRTGSTVLWVAQKLGFSCSIYARQATALTNEVKNAEDVVFPSYDSRGSFLTSPRFVLGTGAASTVTSPVPSSQGVCCLFQLSNSRILPSSRVVRPISSRPLSKQCFLSTSNLPSSVPSVLTT